MKHIRKIVLVFILSLLFATKVDAAEFVCKIGGYEVIYNTSGEIVSVRGLENKIYTSAFSPKAAHECPKNDEGKVELTSGGIEVRVSNIEQDIYESEIKKDRGGCNQYTIEKSCRNNKYYACVWNETKYGDYCNVDNLLYVRCGDAKDIPHQAPIIISFAVNFLKILTPIILIVASIISLLRAVAASNEDEIKKAQKGLIRKMIAAVMVFLVITIVQFVIMKVADKEVESDSNGKLETTNLSDCLDCFLNNECGDVLYYKTYVGSELTETKLKRNE